jgi:Flp pilus assembly protein TadD
MLLAAYANHFRNSFHFDDAHTIVNNAAIQSVRNIPRFFVDATTFSSLPSNQSYRPLVSTLFAIDYALGDLRPFWYHLSIFTLFLALVLFIAFVVYQLIDNLWIAFAAAALYGLHPANADTVNYIIASADVISTLGIVASFAIYVAFPDLRRYYIYVLPAAIAILTKPTAGIFPVLLAVYWILFADEAQCSHAPVKRRTAHRAVATTSWVREVIPPFLICAAVVLVVQAMTPQSWVAGARDAHNYLITQPYVALLYFKTFFWPNNLSADYDLNPFTSASDPRLWVGLCFIILLVTMSILSVRLEKTRVIGFGLLWFLICLLPTSLYPLAEVMNDHRTFLPYIGLIITLAGVTTLLICRGSSLLPLPVGRQRLPLQTLDARQQLPPKIIAVIVVLALCTSATATFQRNKVWKTEETLWHDVTIKSPQNSRGLMNYGNTLMAKGDFNGALDYFHRALALAPQYSVLFVNLAIAEGATKQTALAEQHFKEAMRLAPFSPDSYTFYARYLLAHSRSQEADTLIRSALLLSPTDVTARGLFAQLNQRQTPEQYLALSLQRYEEGRYLESIAAAQIALEIRPDYPEAFNNVCAANNKLGRYDEAAKACEQALRLKPDFDLARNNLQYARKMGNIPAK